MRKILPGAAEIPLRRQNLRLRADAPVKESRHIDDLRVGEVNEGENTRAASVGGWLDHHPFECDLIEGEEGFVVEVGYVGLVHWVCRVNCCVGGI